MCAFVLYAFTYVENLATVLIQEGAQLLEGKELEKTRAQTAATRTDGGEEQQSKEEEEEEEAEEPKKPRLPRESTMAVTAQVDLWT